MGWISFDYAENVDENFDAHADVKISWKIVFHVCASWIIEVFRI